MTGKELRAIRIGMALTQQEFGEELGFKPKGAKAYISRLESGKSPISENVLAKLKLFTGPMRGPNWVCGEDEEGQQILAHLHPPRFSARVDEDSGISSGLSVAVPETGEILCGFIFTDPKPADKELFPLLKEASKVWAEYAARMDREFE